MIRAVLLDIEGTVGDIAFVRDVLFPFARKRLLPVLTGRWNDAEIASCVAAARDVSGQALGDAQTAAALFAQWIDEDKKITPLKSLQGVIWREGYRSGELQAHLYPDAVEAMRAWHQRGLKLFIYSSGSVEAQKLYFAHSVAGDLCPLISGYFDTTTGAKGDASSYAAISELVGADAQSVAFFSDSKAEIDAAQRAGLRTYLVDRKALSNDLARNQINSFAPVISAV